MPSTPRYYILDDHSLFHVTWKCHNNDWLLKEDWAKQLYYNLLLKYKDRYGVQIYAYCFMDNHPHLTGKLKSLKDFSDFFRVVNSCFARFYNKKVGRRGQVVMDRFKSPRIESEADLFKVMFYIDLNPKRAGKVSHPKQNTFSSYNYYAFGKSDSLVTSAPSYLGLGKSPQARQKIYQSLVESILKNDWKEKVPYSSVSFIGNPIWVRQQIYQLKMAKTSYYRDWKQRYKKRFANYI
ncbi:MAG: transposase [Deltaproteobacteria bacterium]|nr:transposase [Deltaproteobacteria bacterium]